MADTSLAGPYKTIHGSLSNAVLRGAAVQLRANGTMLQFKYDDQDDESWQDLIDLQQAKDYEGLINKPTINGAEIIGEISTNLVSPDDALTNLEIEELLN